MKASAVWLLGVVLVPFWALAQAPAGLNTITSVQVNGGTVTISGSKKPNFTTFTMTDPPRLVIDISEAVFSGVPEEMQVGNGTVTGVRTASYGSDESAIARVLIGFEREVETDIQANDSQLVVRVAGSSGAAVAQAQPEPAAAQPTTDGSPAQASAAAEQERQAQAKAAADAAAAAQAERQAQEKAAADAAAAAQAERQAQEKAAADAAAAARAENEERERQTREAEARAAAQREEEKRAAEAAAEERKRQEADARAAAQAAADEKRAAAEEAAAERKRQAEEARAAARTAAEEKRAAAEAAAEEAAEARRQREEEARAERERRQQERLAMASQSRERREVASKADASVSISSRRKTMTLVGFQQQAGTSRVFVRTNEPARYSVSEQGNAVVLEVENSRIDLSNNTRPLDTSYFNSPVTRVEADADGGNVRVTIQLRQQAPVQAHQDGNVISLDFQRTGR